MWWMGVGFVSDRCWMVWCSLWHVVGGSVCSHLIWVLHSLRGKKPRLYQLYLSQTWHDTRLKLTFQLSQTKRVAGTHIRHHNAQEEAKEERPKGDGESRVNLPANCQKSTTLSTKNPSLRIFKDQKQEES